MFYRSLVIATAFTLLTAPITNAQTAAPAALSATRPGWVVAATPHSFAALVTKVEETVKANKMGVVNAASASDGAKAQGFTIPGNRVIGVYRNDFARRMLTASIPAGIEAPIRFYLTEGADGKASLSYVKPSSVFAPYLSGAGADLKMIADELDVIFAKIHAEAIAP
jgi:uncharacterized protein (DUF302 family)